MNYFDEYAKDICEGLNFTIVTDGTGKELEKEQAYEIWAERAHVLHESQNGLMFFCGNGASATMAEHMSHDWFQNGQINTYSVSETSHITAISNDLSYEDVFAYRINRICSERDTLVTISSSGNSPNVVKAIKTAKEKGVFVITVSGKKADNKSRSMGDLNFYVPLDTYGMVESAHAILVHGVLDYYLDKYMGGRH
jgi:D-sedoheptulose 7-phosphate isomerase